MKTEKPKPLDELLKTCAAQEKGLANAAAYINQLQRILFLTVQAAGGRVELKEAAINPLWKLEKNRLEDGTLVLQTSINAPPTKEQMDLLVSKLRGTEAFISDVQKELGLELWSEDYLAFQMVDRLLYFEGKWVDADIVKAASKQNEQN